MPERFGEEKSPAFRGLRHPAVDYLVAAYDIAMRNNWPKKFESQRAAFVEARREFISHVQEVLDPRSQNQIVAQLIQETRIAATETRSALERMAEPKGG